MSVVSHFASCASVSGGSSCAHAVLYGLAGGVGGGRGCGFGGGTGGAVALQKRESLEVSQPAHFAGWRFSQARQAAPFPASAPQYLLRAMAHGEASGESGCCCSASWPLASPAVMKSVPLRLE